MLRKIARVLVMTALCTVLVAGSAFAEIATKQCEYSFTLGNTGTSITHLSDTTNQKKYTSNPWTLYVRSIASSGSYGVRFAPAKVTANEELISVCTQSGVWRASTGYGTVSYASGDAVLGYYKLGARQDDSFTYSFTTSGWWNADKLSN